MKKLLLSYSLFLIPILSLPKDLFSQNVGIGTSSPGTKLHVVSGASGYVGGYFPGIILEGNGHTYFNLISPNSNETSILFGKASDIVSGGIIYNNTSTLNGFQFRTNGNLARMVIDNTGQVGIGTLSPNAPLGFPPALGKKITLYPGATGDVGMAVQGNLLQIYSDNPGADIAFGYDVSGTMTERMRIKGNGNVGIGNNNPAYQLDISNRMRIRSGGNNSVSAGLWLNDNANTEAIFIGMKDDVHLGFFGSAGAGWSFGMNTITGNISTTGDVGIRTLNPTAALHVNGYTKLGSNAPSVRMKKLTATTASFEGGTAVIDPGVDHHKILSVSIFVTNGANEIPPNYTNSTSNYTWSFNTLGELLVTTVFGQSASILSKPIRILLIYEE